MTTWDVAWLAARVAAMNAWDVWSLATLTVTAVACGFILRAIFRETGGSR